MCFWLSSKLGKIWFSNQILKNNYVDAVYKIRNLLAQLMIWRDGRLPPYMQSVRAAKCVSYGGTSEINICLYKLVRAAIGE